MDYFPSSFRIFLLITIISHFACEDSVNKVLKTYDKTKFSEFSIDPAYELAKFILEEGPEVRLTHRKEFCVVSSQTCATYPKSYGPCVSIINYTDGKSLWNP